MGPLSSLLQRMQAVAEKGQAQEGAAGGYVVSAPKDAEGWQDA